MDRRAADRRPRRVPRVSVLRAPRRGKGSRSASREIRPGRRPDPPRTSGAVDARCVEGLVSGSTASSQATSIVTSSMKVALPEDASQDRGRIVTARSRSVPAAMARVVARRSAVTPAARHAPWASSADWNSGAVTRPRIEGSVRRYGMGVGRRVPSDARRRWNHRSAHAHAPRNAEEDRARGQGWRAR